MLRISSDNLAVGNQTNLAIKGIIAIQAMSAASQAIGLSDDAARFAASVLRRLVYLQTS